MSNELATIDEGMLAILGETKATGFEDTTQDDFGRVFLKMVQKAEDHPDPDAERGDIFHSSSKELYKDGVEFIPFAIKHDFIEFTDEAKGQFKGSYSHTDPVVKEVQARCPFNDLKMQNGNKLVETYSYQCLFKDSSGEWTPGIISCAGTSITPAKNWNSTLRSARYQSANGKKDCPVFMHICKAETEIKSKKGNDTSIWKFSYVNPGSHENSYVTDPSLLSLAAGLAERAAETEIDFANEDAQS